MRTSAMETAGIQHPHVLISRSRDGGGCVDVFVGLVSRAVRGLRKEAAKTKSKVAEKAGREILVCYENGGCM